MNQYKDPQSQSALTSFILNVLVPVFILNFMSEGAYNILDRSNGRDLWDLGPIWSMVVALILPFAYGLYALIKQRKFELMSAVGLTSVTLTGTLTFFVVTPGGGINPSTPWLFGLKEALIPLSLAIAVLLSHKKKTPLFRTFIYSPSLFDIAKIERAITRNKQESNYNSLLWGSTLILTGALFMSSLGNYLLAHHYLGEVVGQPGITQHVQYNLAVGKITGLAFLIIGVPMVAALLYIVTRLVSQLQKLTGLKEDDIMPRR